MDREEAIRILDGNTREETLYMYDVEDRPNIIARAEYMAIKALKEQRDWIMCSERLPEEHDSIFAKFKGTDKWNDFMFEKTSDEVNATVEFEDGKRKTMTLYTIDGKWKTGIRSVKFKVIAWQPLPDSCKD